MSLRTLGIAGLALLVSAGAAFAHPHVVKTLPGAEVKGSPKEVRITFSEAVVAKLSGAEIATAAGAVVKTGPAQAAQKDLIVPVAATLAPGVYKVNWHAVASDTHRVTGTFNFTVK